ncbi:hypothetical protein FB45DRAFT_975082 [Roridomyces roridus]|uniref:Matrin-type domain-containing protein n=1 Tax=Roridomyces roridus TaxID=1738132 RepID=A0AAD7CFU7_9AGAR|nr:hypothetical protein FB45DRAFT_975082 [Roridomyces roridus]
MSEYWVSKKKYFCKYCDIYITDDVPSRQQHENGLRHKGNQERFIRSIYKAGEKKKKDDEEERREMKRVEQAAQIAYAQDVGAGHAKLSSSAPVASTSAAPPAAKKPQKPANLFANYSTAKSLGYDDPDAERLAAEAERQRSQGVVGHWQMVAPSTTDAPPPDTGSKRSAEALDADESREFKLRKKTVGTGLGQIYDPGAITIKLKKEEPEPVPEQPAAAPSLSTETDNKPRWSKLQWKKAGDPVDQTDDATKLESEADVQPKTEEDPPLDKPTVKEEELPVKVEEPAVLFKKRKAPTAGSRGKRS